jgi:hypothetical protein
MITNRFPKAGFILLRQSDTAYPFSAFPKIQMGHDHLRRLSMIWRERFIVIFQGDKRLTVYDVG